jgi:hypothetical protein
MPLEQVGFRRIIFDDIRELEEEGMIPGYVYSTREVYERDKPIVEEINNRFERELLWGKTPPKH